VSDFLQRTVQLLRESSTENVCNWLLRAQVAHPLDNHPTLAERAEALNVDASATIRQAIAELVAEPTSPQATFVGLEEAATAIETRHARVPGIPVVSDEADAQPVLLGAETSMNTTSMNRT